MLLLFPSCKKKSFVLLWSGYWLAYLHLYQTVTFEENLLFCNQFLGPELSNTSKCGTFSGVTRAVQGIRTVHGSRT